MAFEVGASRYLQIDATGEWVPVAIVSIDSAPWSDLVVVRMPDGREVKTDAESLETEPPTST